MDVFKEIQELVLKFGCEFTLVIKPGLVKAEIKQDFEGKRRFETNEMHGDAMALGDIRELVERGVENIKLPHPQWRP